MNCWRHYLCSGLISLRGRSISWPASLQSMDSPRSGRARPSGTAEELLCDPRTAKSRMGENVAPTPSSPASSAGLTTGYPNCAHPRPLHQPSQWPPIRLTPSNLPATPAKGRCTIQHQEDRLTECGQGTLLGPNMITGVGPGSVLTPTQVPDHDTLPLGPATQLTPQDRLRLQERGRPTLSRLPDPIAIPTRADAEDWESRSEGRQCRRTGYRHCTSGIPVFSGDPENWTR